MNRPEKAPTAHENRPAKAENALANRHDKAPTARASRPAETADSLANRLDKPPTARASRPAEAASTRTERRAPARALRTEADTTETANARTGRLGEEATAEALRRGGFEIVARNWRAGRYELDIVARRADELHFVEVKTRRAGALTPPEEALTPQKRRALRRAVEAFVAASGSRYDGFDLRFDLAAVHRGAEGELRIDWFADAVEYGW